MGIRLIYVILEIEWFHQYTVVARLILHLLTCQGMGHRWWHERIIAFFTRTSHDDSPIEAFFMVSNYKHLKAGELNTYKTDVPGHAICIYVYTHVHTIQTHTIYYTYTIRILYVYITGAIHTLYVDIRRYALIYTGIHYPSIHQWYPPPNAWFQQQGHRFLQGLGRAADLDKMSWSCHCVVTYYRDYMGLSSGSQTWQWENHYKWRFLAGKIIYKWWIFTCRVWLPEVNKF